VIQTIDLVGFLMLGLLGGFGHCVGMCSPFVLFVSRRYAPAGGGRAAVLGAQGWYTAGRILTYAGLGAAAGALGSVVELAGGLLGVQRAASIVAGGVLVIWAVVALSDLLPRLDAGGSLFTRVAGALKGRVPGHPFATGLFLGLLPCGLLYSALIAAAARGGAFEGAAALALFGIGTAPALLGVSVADELLARNRAVINRLSQVFLLAMGLWFLWTGFAGRS
jgi:sulfite exporter TauE/SafE